MKLIAKIGQFIVDFFYHSSVYSMTQVLVQKRVKLDTLFMLLIFGDMLGVPVFMTYYSMRLWPYLLMRMGSWKRNLLRPKGLGYW
jgi:hypothetical protein